MTANSRADQFFQEMIEAYSSSGDSLVLGGARLDGSTCTDCLVRVPLKMLNRHGLVAGATGSGKTKSIQGIAGSLSQAGVPVLMMDIKGDLSGLAKPGDVNDFINKRHAEIGFPFAPHGHPVELLSLTGSSGLQMRATASEFGPLLLSKVLKLNGTQEGTLAVIFQYCDEQKLPLLNLADLKKTLQYAGNEGRHEISKAYGKISSATTSTILRKVVALEQQGADAFFGERSFEVSDLLRTDNSGQGVISIVRLTDVQDKPRLFSTFMLSLLAEVYATLPEAGDLPKPKLVIVLDEAHVIFDQASSELLDQLEAIVKLIRSKGVGLIFCTQTPADVPASILGQLGLKVQHAQRAFTAADRKKIKLSAENFPESSYYDPKRELTELAVGEAFVTALDEKGTPTPLVRTLMCAPTSRMGILDDAEISALLNASTLKEKYANTIDSKSAYEILSAKLEDFQSKDQQETLKGQRKQAKLSKQSPYEKKSLFERLFGKAYARQLGRTVLREVTRGLLGVLGLGGGRRR